MSEINATAFLKIETLSNKLAELRKQDKEISKQISRICNQLTKEIDKRDEAHLNKHPNDYENILQYYDEQTSITRNYVYNLRNKFTDWKNGFIFEGAWPETKQACIKIVVRKDGSNIKVLLKLLSKFLPYVKPITHQKGRVYKYINVMEKELSEYGSYHLAVLNDKIELIREWHGYEAVHATKTMDAMLNYMAKECYYES